MFLEAGGCLLALADHHQPIGGDAEADEVLPHGVGAALPKCEVVLAGAAGIAVALDRYARGGPTTQPLGVGLKDRTCIFPNRPLIEIEQGVTERAFRARGNFQIVVDRTAGDGVQAELARQRATPIVYVVSSEYSSTIIYGFYRDFTVKIEQPTFSICEIEIEGLT